MRVVGVDEGSVKVEQRRAETAPPGRNVMGGPAPGPPLPKALDDFSALNQIDDQDHDCDDQQDVDEARQRVAGHEAEEPEDEEDDEDGPKHGWLFLSGAPQTAPDIQQSDFRASGE
jgi:hypothetical protein